MSRLFKIILALSTLGAACGQSLFAQQEIADGLFLQAQKKEETSDEAFQNFISKNKKNYKDKAEFAKRKKEFVRNWGIVKKHNATRAGYALEINEFADWTADEFKKILTIRPLSSKR